MSDAEADEARGAAIVHLDPSLVPAAWSQTHRQELVDDASEFEGSAEWLIYTMEFVHDDRVGLLVDGDATAVLRGTLGTTELAEAEEEARSWVEASGQEAFRVPFGFLPNIFQYALMTSVSGRRLEPTPAYFIWAPADLDAGAALVTVRRFPPDTNADDDEGKWSLMPIDALRQMLDERGW